ncbi:MAG: helix-turn-helix transcriptional regulator [Ktedonobacteraceae bacterium]
MNILLRRARLQACLTQEKLASTLGTTPISIWRWESGKNMPSYYFRTLICAYFKRPPDAFGWPSPTQKNTRMSCFLPTKNQSPLAPLCTEHRSTRKGMKHQANEIHCLALPKREDHPQNCLG